MVATTDMLGPWIGFVRTRLNLRCDNDPAMTSGDDPRLHTFNARRVWIMVNPRAGRGLAVAAANAIAFDLRRDGINVVQTHTHPAATSRPDGEIDAAIVLGGDGTVRSAVARLIELGDVPPVLPVPMGTANLLGKHLGLERNLWNIAYDGIRQSASGFLSTGRLGRRVMRIGRRTLLPGPRRLAKAVSRDVCRVLKRGHARRLDIGHADGHGPFLLMAGVGFDAHVVAELDRRRTGPIGLTSYALPAASALLSGRMPAVTVEVDGREVFGPKPGIVMVANAPEYGAGFELVPGARTDDGLLDVVCLPGAGPGHVLRWTALAAMGRHTSSAGVVRARGQVVTIRSAGEVPVQVDGDPGGRLPITLRVRPAAVPFVTLADEV